MNTPKIKISGPGGSGVSSLAFAIKDALKKHDIEVVISGAEDEKPGRMDVLWEKRINCLHGAIVELETSRTKFRKIGSISDPTVIHFHDENTPVFHKIVAAPICALTLIVGIAMLIVAFPFLLLIKLYDWIFQTNSFIRRVWVGDIRRGRLKE